MAVFAATMDAFGPFENNPHLAVAVSGGPDSTALAIMARDWAQARAGRITALTVDHGLRPASAGEARWVGDQMRTQGIDHEVLAWMGDKPRAGIQAAARSARYGLLRGWCRDASVLHLLAGHQRDDQAETRLMRLARGKAHLGAAGISAVREYSDIRLLRPLLGQSRDGLRAWLTALGVPWIDEESNVDQGFERVRARRRLAAEPGLAAGLDTDGYAAARARQNSEERVHQRLARALSFSEFGFADLERKSIGDDDTAAVALGRVITSIGGRDYAPATDALVRLVDQIADKRFSGATLGGCQVRPAADGKVFVCREARNLPAPVTAQSGDEVDWDGRFRLCFADDLPAGQGIAERMTLRSLGHDGWRQIPSDTRRQRGTPMAAALSLPALFRRDDLYWWPGAGESPAAEAVKWAFRPKNAVSFSVFCIA
ncbi:MAG: tRNA lysidine(34) synthetase TilS [Rhodospirillaceae bacterium]